MKKYKAIMHFNKQMQSQGYPWTIHYKGVCHSVKKIICNVPMLSEFKPNKKDNPRAFFTAQVTNLFIDEDGVATLT